MTKHPRRIVVAALLVAASGLALRAQDRPAQGPPSSPASTPPAPFPAPRPDQPRLALVPLKVQVVIARYQGEKKISSLPYSIVVNANDGWPPGSRKAQLRTGSQIAVGTSLVAADGKPSTPFTSYQYHSVGTNIDCSAQSTDDGRYRLELSVDDTSVYPDSPTAQSGAVSSDKPTFRNFRFDNSLLLRDGQTMQFTAATDKVTGEQTRIDVTLNVVK